MSDRPSDRLCPKCSSDDIFLEEVDIGVGIQYGPLHCHACGFDEEKDTAALLKEHGLDEPRMWFDDSTDPFA